MTPRDPFDPPTGYDSQFPQFPFRNFKQEIDFPEKTKTFVAFNQCIHNETFSHDRDCEF